MTKHKKQRFRACCIYYQWKPTYNYVSFDPAHDLKRRDIGGSPNWIEWILNSVRDAKVIIDSGEISELRKKAEEFYNEAQNIYKFSDEEITKGDLYVSSTWWQTNRYFW